MPDVKRDFFICHASEDKQEIVRPLVQALGEEGISCWLDEAEIHPGDSISNRVSGGLANSRYVLIILSTAFSHKWYPGAELSTVLLGQASTGEGRAIPLLVGSEEQIARIFEQLPQPLRDRAYIRWKGDPRDVVDHLLPLLGRESKPVRRVCFISSEYPPNVFGGLGVHVEQLAKALGEHIDVDIVLPTIGTEYESRSPRVHPHSLANASASYDDPVSWLRFAELAADKIRRLAEENRPDVIHCHDWVTVLAGIKCRWALGIPLVFHLHLPNRSPLCASVENLGLLCADLVTVNSEAMSEELVDRNLVIRRAGVVKNGVDRDLFRPGEDWPSDGGYILFVGRLVEQKGVEYLLRAVYYAREKFPDVRLKIVGEGPFRPLLERLCTNLTISREVDFLGWKTGPELARLYQQARLAVVPSIYEPFGMTALEALACGRPVVASRVGGLKEIVKHRVTGFLAEPKDHLDLAQWLMTGLASEDLRNSLGQAGGEFVSQKAAYTWPRIAQQFVKMYRTLQGKPLDLAEPRGAWKFIDQIDNVARELSPAYRDRVSYFGPFVRRLFYKDWQ
jgi:glycogen(starch) synthase